jgi:hypothetical protein
MQSIREIFSHASDYYVQFIGRYPKGRKAIFCNFVTIDRPDEIASFRKEWFWATDGGSDFWYIWYEPDKDELLRVHSKSMLSETQVIATII